MRVDIELAVVEEELVALISICRELSWLLFLSVAALSSTHFL